MNRETEQHFSTVPMIKSKRSKFDVSHSVKTTFNVDDIVPIEVNEILPGDTVQLDLAEIVRMATPIFPVMDNLVMDVYNFFVPARLTWEHWQEFWGENDDPWIQQTEYEVPQIEAPEGGWTAGTIADYMGLPTYVDGISVSALPFRAYAKVYNDWFRDENLCYNCHINLDETTRTGSNGSTTVTDVELGGMPAKGAKLHDYFTSQLKEPQKGPAVTIPLGTSATVKTAERNSLKNLSPIPLHFEPTTGTQFVSNTGFPGAGQTGVYTSLMSVSQNSDQTDSWGTALMADANQQPSSASYYATPNNLYADLSDATAATISQLRTAFAIQKYYEQIGRSGSRYIEWLRGVFGVESSDARLQRSEYLGGTRVPINIDQVLQTSSTDATSPQGNTGAFSCTRANNSMFTKSFEEHGFILTMVLVRTEHTYQQGIEQMWSRKKWTDFYNPFFANLSEMPVYNKEIFAQGTAEDDQAMGYQEAWASYRYKQNRVTSAMRSNYPNGSLDAWHYADDYKSLPALSKDWIEEPVTNVDRTIAVQSQITNQFIADFYFKEYMTRCMPVYSVPGLIDHA